SAVQRGAHLTLAPVVVKRSFQKKETNNLKTSPNIPLTKLETSFSDLCITAPTRTTINNFNTQLLK
ncbi:hypothetical protein, partial [Endozoicomonas sp. SESOKO3]|uniref:hypothetical protein n=1 Tax=Endozoicomonas sp. SESOKO3 TaxID=2828744 RepID=UPI0021494828